MLTTGKTCPDTRAYAALELPQTSANRHVQDEDLQISPTEVSKILELISALLQILFRTRPRVRCWEDGPQNLAQRAPDFLRNLPPSMMPPTWTSWANA